VYPEDYLCEKFATMVRQKVERGGVRTVSRNAFLKPVLMFLATTVAIWPKFRQRNAKAYKI
jgi:hypothetical protein